MTAPTETSQGNNSLYEVSSTHWNAAVNAMKNQPYSYIIYTDGSKYYAKNGETGEVSWESTNSSSVWQNTIDATTSGGHIQIIGEHHLEYPIQPKENIRFTGTNFGSGGTIVYLDHEGVGFDLTGLNFVTFENMRIENGTGYTPTCYFLLARDSGADDAGSHRFFNVYMIGEVDSGNGFVYNYGSESVFFGYCRFLDSRNNENSLIFTPDNHESVTSSFETIATGSQSMTEVRFYGCDFRKYPNDTGYHLYIRGAAGRISVEASYFGLGWGVFADFNGGADINNLALKSCNFEGKVLYASGDGSRYFKTLTLQDIYVEKSGTVTVLDTTNVQMLGLHLNGWKSAETTHTIHVLNLDHSDVWLHDDYSREPTLTVDGGVTYSRVDVYDDAHISIGGATTGSDIIIRENGKFSENTGSSTGTGAEQTIAHGLAGTPTLVFLSNGDAVSNPYQSSSADATNIYVTADSGETWYWYAKYVL